MRSILEKEKLTKVLVHRDQSTIFARTPFQDGAVTGIRPALSTFNNVVTRRTQPLCKAPAGAAIDEESQPTRTASSVSPAITLCA